MTDDEFKYLMGLPKHVTDDRIIFPKTGSKGKEITVVSDTTKHIFVIDTDRRSTIEISKVKIQERYLNVPELLVRLEINCPPHINPDGKKLSRNHIHLYSEEYGMRYAYDLSNFSETLFLNQNNFISIFDDFCKFCKIKYDNIISQGVL